MRADIRKPGKMTGEVRAHPSWICKGRTVYLMRAWMGPARAGRHGVPVAMASSRGRDAALRALEP